MPSTVIKAHLIFCHVEPQMCARRSEIPRRLETAYWANYRSVSPPHHHHTTTTTSHSKTVVFQTKRAENRLVRSFQMNRRLRRGRGGTVMSDTKAGTLRQWVRYLCMYDKLVTYVHTLVTSRQLRGQIKPPPILWQQKLKNPLQGQGFKEIPHEPCCMARNGILIFFYVDDIVFAHPRKDKSSVQRIVNDFHDFKQGFGGWTSLVILTDR